MKTFWTNIKKAPEKGHFCALKAPGARKAELW